MERILYHGSEFVIRSPEYGKGNIHNDYGLGFYCCTNKELAKEWAAKRTGRGFVNSYSLRDDNLKILDLTKPPYDSVLYWVALLLNNRELSSEILNNYPRELKYLKEKFLIDTSKFDVVIGYRADDSYFRFPVSFVRSEITLESLNRIFLAGELGKQYVVISKKAFSLLKFLDFEEAIEQSKQNYYKRKDKADHVYETLLNEDRYAKGTKLRDLVVDYE